MHNREITHIVKIDSLSKTRLVVKTYYSVLLSVERNLCQDKKNQHYFIKTQYKS